MKILLTCPYPVWPANFGSGRRVVSLAQALSIAGHQVTVLSAQTDGPCATPDLEHICWLGYRSTYRASHFINYAFWRAYQQALSTSPDLIWAAFPYQAWMLLPPVRARGIPVVYDAHNIEGERFAHLGRPFIARLVRYTEASLCRCANAILTVSPEDQALLWRCYHRRSLLLPNGINPQEFCPEPPDAALLAHYQLTGKKVVLYVGSYDYQPNLEALDLLAHRIWPKVAPQDPQARLLAVGRRPPEWARNVPGVIVAGAVEDIVAHLRLAHVVVVPLLRGGGTRLKILEALACGQRVLSTPEGAQGIPYAANQGITYSDIETFADHLNALLANPPQPCSHQAARQFALQFDWNRLIKQLDWPQLVENKKHL